MGNILPQPFQDLTQLAYTYWEIFFTIAMPERVSTSINTTPPTG